MKDLLIVELDEDLYINLRDVIEAERFPDRLRVVMRSGYGRDLRGPKAARLARWLRAVSRREPDELAFGNPLDTTPLEPSDTAPAESAR